MLVLVRECSSTEAAAPELSASRKTPTAVATTAECTGMAATGVAAAGESSAVAARVTSPHGGRRRTASQRDHEEGGEEEYWQPTVPRSCGAGHDHTPEATTVPSQYGAGEANLESEPPILRHCADPLLIPAQVMSYTRRKESGLCRMNERRS